LALSDSSAALLAPLLSAVIISGSPFLSMAFSKKRRAASGLVTMGAQQEIDRIAFLVDRHGTGTSSRPSSSSCPPVAYAA
jgi:hypothetical protein